MSYIGAKPITAEYYFDAFNGDGSTTTFLCAFSPASPVSAIVSVNGSVVDPEDYFFDGPNIVFATAPSAGTRNIQIRYLAVPASGIAAPKTYRQIDEYTATEGQTVFPVKRYDLGYVDVYVNGVQLGNMDFQASDQENVVLQIPARLGDLVRVVSAYNTLLARQTVVATQNYALLGNGSGPLQEVQPSTANNLFMSDGNTWISQATIFNYDGTVRGNITPDTANSYYLGSNTKPFHSIHVGPGSVYIGNTGLKTVNNELVIENANLRITDLNITGNGSVAGNLSVSQKLNIANTIIDEVAGTLEISNTDVQISTNLNVVGSTEVTNLEVTGNLIVRGNTTEFNTTTITANDTLLYLGSNNYYSDTHDIGFISHYNSGSKNTHTGLFRNATDKEYYLFSEYDPEISSNNNIDINDSSFAYANLRVKNIISTQNVYAGNVFSNGVDLSNVTSQLITGNTPPVTVVTYVNTAISSALANVPEPTGANSAVRLSDLVSLPSDLFINVLGSLDIQLTATNALDGSVTQAGAPSYIYNQSNASITGQANTVGQNYSVINSTYNTTGGGGYRAIVTMRIDVANAAGLSNTRYISGMAETEANTRPDWKGNYDFQAFSALFKLYEINFWDYPWLSGASPGSAAKGTGATFAYFVNMTPVTSDYTSVYWGHYNIECNVYAVATYHNANIGARWFGLATKKRNLYLNLSYNP